MFQSRILRQLRYKTKDTTSDLFHHTDSLVTCHLSLTRLENVKLPSNDTDVAPPYVVRAIFMYGRSYSMPVYKSNLDVSVFGWICVTLSRVTDVRLTVLQSCVHFVSASSSALLGGVRFAPFTQIEMGMQEV